VLLHIRWIGNDFHVGLHHFCSLWRVLLLLLRVSLRVLLLLRHRREWMS
jgi:hypothetical protein